MRELEIARGEERAYRWPQWKAPVMEERREE